MPPAGLRKQKTVDWKDTNMALFGTDVEYKIKEAAANTEAAWDIDANKKGLLIWRIEQFKVVPWPKEQYGQFHTGDSYIVLHTYCPHPKVNPDVLAWDIHFWIGNESTQDEYGTAAYKTVELDDFLKRKATQYREVQEHESSRFTRLFRRGCAICRAASPRASSTWRRRTAARRCCGSRGAATRSPSLRSSASAAR